MSFIHNNSSECPKAQLEIFALPPTQLSMEGNDMLFCSPSTSLECLGPIEYIIPESEDHYINPAETYLHVVLSVVNEKGEALKAEDKVAPVNLLLHSLFSEISIYINSKLINPPSMLYPYRSLIEVLFNYNTTAKDTHLTASLYYKDTAGAMSDLASNVGLATRRSFIAESKQLSMVGRLSINVFGQYKFLPNNLPIKVMCTKSKPSFCLIGETGKKYNINIHKADLIVQRVKINPSILLAHSKILATTTAKYAVSRVEMKSFTINSGGLSFEQKLFNSQEPIRVIVGLIDNAAQSDIALNPFDFQHYDMNYLSLTRNGVPVTTRPLQPSFDPKSPDYMLSYINTFRAVGIGSQDDGYQISRNEYGYGGYCLHCFDLTADGSASYHQWSLRRHSLIEISIRFAKAIPTTLSLIVYGEFQSLIEIDCNRRVTTDF